MKDRKLVTTIMALALGFCLLYEVPATQAQSMNSRCRIVRGNLEVAFSPGAANGSITNSGFLNGSVTTSFQPGSVMPTANPTSITFTGDTTLTTLAGTLVTHDVYLFDFVLMLGPAMLRIDPGASTGIFAGATGVIYINPVAGSTDTGQAELGGRLCFAE